MSDSEVIFKDKDGFHYKHPERSCRRCLNYPCLPNMSKLLGNFAAYGCRLWSNTNIFNIEKKKK